MSSSQPIQSSTELAKALQKLALFRASELQAMRTEWENREHSPRPLVKQLADQGKLTAYQANEILAGRADELVLGQYLLLEPKGEGGMGKVFKALHRLMNRVVALKMIRKEFLNESALSRFQREIHVLAQLSHPNIVSAFDAEVVHEQIFLVMEYCEGPTLKCSVEETEGMPVGWACEWIRQAALGLQHAHEHGLIHRDIKPSNLILALPANAAGENFIVKILDLGLSRLKGTPHAGMAVDTLTGQNTLMGTPDYIAPEQARDARHADIRSDLYSLGCTFYFALTGQPPFPGGTTVEKVLRHQTEDPASLEQLRSDVPGQVQEILRQLMAKDPAERLQTPAALASALDPFAIVKEMPVSIPDAASIKGNRSEEKTLKAPTVPSTPLPGAPLTVSYSPDPTPAPSKNTGLRSDSSLYKKVGRPLSLLVLVGVLGITVITILVLTFPWNNGNTQSSGTDDKDNEKRIPKSKPLSTRWQSFVPLTYSTNLRVGEPSPMSPQGIAFSPDSRLLAVAYGNYSLFPTTGAVVLWDVSTGKIFKVLNDVPRAVWCLTFSPDGQWLVAGCGTASEVQLGGGELVVWKMPDAVPFAMFSGHDRGTNALAFTRDGKTLFSAGEDGKLMQWDVKTTWQAVRGFPRITPVVVPKHLTLFHKALSSIHGMAISADDNQLAFVTQNRVQVWNIPTKRKRFDWTSQFGGHVVTTAFAPRGDILLMGTSTRHLPGTEAELLTADLKTGFCRSQKVEDRLHVICVAFAPDGQTFVTTHWGGAFRFWQSKTKTILDTQNWPEWKDNYLFFATYSPNGQFVAVSCESRNVLLCKVPVQLKKK